MKLAYKAVDQAGKAINDTIDAPSADDAMDRLRGRGLYVTEIVEPAQQAAAHVASSSRRISAGRRLKHLSALCRQLYVLMASGTPLVQALAASERQTRDVHLRAVLASVRDRVEEGQPLSEAMEAYPHYFDSVTRSLVAAGESGGKLAPMLDRLAVLSQKQLQTRKAVTGALVYPAMLTCVSAGVLLLMLLFVLPRFTHMFEAMDAQLPQTTQWLMAISDALRGYWWLMLMLVIGTVVGLRLYARTPRGRELRDTAMVRLPLVGPVTRNFAVARIIRLLGVLLAGKVPLLESLQLTRDATTNGHYVALLNDAHDAAQRGEPLSSAFDDESLIPISVCEAIRNGEHTGQLDTLLLTMAGFMDEENDVLVRSLTTILEPAILIVLGLLVGVVAISMFLPLFDLATMSSGGMG